MTAASRFERICALQIRAGNADWVTEQRDAALKKITAGGGGIRVIEKGALNGKTVEADILLNALDVADIAQTALDEAAGENHSATGITFIDFGGCR